jgi:5'(3')-deoxyribonucleotidase
MVVLARHRYLEKIGNAHEIAPRGTKCHDFEQRLAIKVGDIVDACDTTSFWYNSTVMNERETMIDESKSIKEIYIGTTPLIL